MYVGCYWFWRDAVPRTATIYEQENNVRFNYRNKIKYVNSFVGLEQRIGMCTAWV